MDKQNSGPVRQGAPHDPRDSFSPRRFQNLIEILRQGALLGGLLLGIAFFFYPEAVLFRVQAVDWEAQWSKQKPRSPGNDPSWGEEGRMPAAGSIEDFVRGKVATATLQVDGADWDDLHRTLRSAQAGDSVEQRWHLRMMTNDMPLASQWFYFRADEAPFGSIREEFSSAQRFRYLLLGGPPSPTASGDSGAPGALVPRTLSATMETPHEAWGDAPWPMLFPLRSAAGWIFLAALLLYVLLPWPHMDPAGVHYSRAQSVVLPGLMGVLLAGVFFALPWGVVLSNSTEGRLFDPEWWPVLVVGWGLALLGASVFYFAARYSCFQVQLRPGRLVWMDLFGVQEIPLGDIAEARMGISKSHRRIIRLLWIVSLFNPRAAATALTLGEDHHCVQIVRRDGRTHTLWIAALLGLDRLLLALRRAGVPFSESLASLTLQMEEEDEGEDEGNGEISPSVPPRASSSRGGVVLRVVAVVMIAAAGFGWFQATRLPNPSGMTGVTAPPEEPPSVEEMQAREAILKKMTRLQSQMESALRIIQTGNSEERLEAQKAHAALMDEFMRLSEEHDAIIERRTKPHTPAAKP